MDVKVTKTVRIVDDEERDAMELTLKDDGVLHIAQLPRQGAKRPVTIDKLRQALDALEA